MVRYRGKPVLFVDIEASALEPGSYPIEIGWAPVIQADGSISHDSFLIRPTTEWREDGTWSPESQQVHGIGPGELMRDGLDVLDAVKRLDTTFAGHLVVSDAIAWDELWIFQLYDAVGRTRSFELISLDALTRGIVAERLLDADRADAAQAAVKQELGQVEHRAGPDAAQIYLQTMTILHQSRPEDPIGAQDRARVAPAEAAIQRDK